MAGRWSGSVPDGGEPRWGACPGSEGSGRGPVTARRRLGGSGICASTPPGSFCTICEHCRSGPSGNMSCSAAETETVMCSRESHQTSTSASRGETVSGNRGAAAAAVEARERVGVFLPRMCRDRKTSTGVLQPNLAVRHKRGALGRENGEPIALELQYLDTGHGSSKAVQRRTHGDKLTVWTKKVLKFLASGRSSCDQGISPFRTLLTGST